MPRSSPSSADVLVVGGGMSGLSAAVAAAQEGAAVTVAEKSDRVGGSAALSAGMFWAPRDVAALRARAPGGDPVLGARLVAEFPGAVAEICDRGVRVGEPFHGIMTIGVGYPIDVHALLDDQVRLLRRLGGGVVLGTRVRRLVCDEGGRVVGVVAQGAGGRTREIRCGAVVLATGGFQGDRELVARYLGPQADSMFVRSHDGNVGDGFRMGQAAGGAASRSLGTFYGHLLPNPLQRVTPDRFVAIAQFFSAHCVLLNRAGRRFCDELEGDEINNQQVLRQPQARAVLVCDDAVHREFGCAEPFPNGGVVDRLAQADQAGGRVAHAATLDELLDEVSRWGVDRAAAQRALTAYNEARARAQRARRTLLLDGVPVRPDAHPISTAPFHAAEVQPSITFTYGGLRAGVDAAVRDRDDRPIPGLFVAGADLGGISHWSYAGGLAMAYITGRWAGASAAAASSRSTS